MNPCCPYCHQPFVPSRFRPHQRVCGHSECQRRRHVDYRRQKLRADPEYRQVCRDSRKKWRDEHPGYLQQYRQSHPQQVLANRLAQRKRDRLGHLQHLGHARAATLDLTQCRQPVWLIGPELPPLEKNILALFEVFIFQKVTLPSAPAPLEKNTLAFH